MRLLAGIILALALLIGIGGCHGSDNPTPVPYAYTTADPLPPGVTTGWPIDPNDPEDTTCGIGIHYEDTFALTDAQLDTARKYVAHTCWGASDNWPTDTEHTYYYHR
jgi:hypothetical protein